MSHKEEKIPNYIDFPYDIFLMLRLEFLALCQDELEAKIMRIIEKAVNDEWERIYRERCASTPKNEPVKMPEQVWVIIPNRYFLDRLLGTVQSETTLKAAMKSLIQKKKFIFRRERRGRYEAPEYTLNKKALVQFFATLPSDPRLLDMKIIMKQERKKNIKEGDQKLTPSKPDPIISEGVKNWPYDHQKLTPSPSKIDPLVELGGDQKLTPTYIDLHNNLDDNLESNIGLSDDEANDAHHLLPTENVESQPTSYRRQEEPNGHDHNDSLAHSALTDCTPDSDLSAEHHAQGDTLHSYEHQRGTTTDQQQGEVTPTSGETAQAQQLEQQANSDNPVAPGGIDTPTPAGKEVTPPEPEVTTQAATNTTATRGEKRGSVKGDASTTEVGGKVEKPTRQRKPAPLTPEEQLAQETELVQAIVKEWRDIFTKKPKPVTETMIKHARTLAAYKPEPGEIVACRLWLYATDKNKYYDGHGMTLGTIASSFERFQSLTEVPKPMIRNGKTTETPKKMDEAKARAESNNLDQLEKLRQRAAQKAVAPKGVSSYAV